MKRRSFLQSIALSIASIQFVAAAKTFDPVGPIGPQAPTGLTGPVGAGEFKLYYVEFPLRAHKHQPSIRIFRRVLPMKILYEASFIQVVGGPILKNRWGTLSKANELSEEFMNKAPLVFQDYLVEHGHVYPNSLRSLL